MDDDAATEPECILRTRRLLAYARDPHLAVTAAMLRAETSFMMHEQGALFEWGRNHRIISRKNGGDLRDRAVLAAGVAAGADRLWRLVVLCLPDPGGHAVSLPDVRARRRLAVFLSQ